MESKMFLLITLISLSVLTITLAILVSLFLFTKGFIATSKGKVIFEIDYENYKFRYLYHKSIENNKLPFTHKNQSVYMNKWQPISKWKKIFDAKSMKSIRNAVHMISMETKNDNLFDVTLKNKPMIKHKNKYNIKMKLDKSVNKIVHATIKYTLIEEELENNEKGKLTNEELMKHKSKRMTIIAFNSNKVKNNKNYKLFQNIQKYFKILGTFYTILDKKVIICIPYNNGIIANQIAKKVQKMKEYILKDISMLGLGSFYSAAGCIDIIKPNNPKSLNDVSIMLEYLIDKSTKTKIMESFERIDRIQFQKYKESFIIFEQSTRTKDIISQETKIKNYSNKKPLATYVYPGLQGINKLYFNKIMNIKKLRDNFINAHVEKLLESSKKKPMLVDVNPEWLIDNYTKINETNIVFIINEHKIKQYKVLLAAIAQLQEQKILCGLRVNNLDIATMNAIQKSKPKFIIIDKSISEKINDPNIYLKLVTLKHFTTYKNVKIIYENPIEQKDKRKIKAISLKFFYDYK